MSKLKIGILDRYIIKKFLGTFFMALLLIIGIVIIFDISEKIDDFVEKEAPLKAIIIDYYFNFTPYFMNMFAPLFVFITVIFFTSKMASHSEIVAVLSGGVSFNRLLYPYFLSAAFIALVSLVLNLFVIPPANAHRQAFEEQYIKNRKANTNRNIHYQIEPNTYVYMESFNIWSNTAVRFTLETVKGRQLVSKLSAESAKWNEQMETWTLSNWYIRQIDSTDRERLTHGYSMDTLIPLNIKDLTSRTNVVQQFNYFQLNDYIATQQMRGDSNVKYALIEKHTRLAMPFSAFILTLMGVSLSSRKRRGGIGLNIGVGIALSFSYILFMRFSEMFVYSGTLPPGLALWLPNILFLCVAIVLYRLAPK